MARQVLSPRLSKVTSQAKQRGGTADRSSQVVGVKHSWQQPEEAGIGRDAWHCHAGPQTSNESAAAGARGCQLPIAGAEGLDEMSEARAQEKFQHVSEQMPKWYEMCCLGYIFVGSDGGTLCYFLIFPSRD